MRNVKEEIKESNETASELNPNGVWKAGDKVKVVFPNAKTDKFAIGILLTDEFLDEDGIPCVIFKPIEDGAVREDLQYKMPAKLIVKV